MYASGCQCIVDAMLCPMCIWQRLAIACEGGVVASPTIAMGKEQVGKGKVAKGKLAKGKVAKVAKKDTEEHKVQKVKAKVHAMKKVIKRPAGKPVPKVDLAVAEEGEEEEPKEQDVEDDEEKPTAKDYYHFNNKLATAPRAVQDAVAKIKALPLRSGKQTQLAQMAAAFAKSKWDHKLFKSMEELEIHRAQKKEAKTYPRQVMVTKCGGEDGFEKASL